MSEDLVQRAHWGDLSGQNWAGLTRLSFEPDEDEVTATADGSTGVRFTPATGRDIKNRDVQDQDNRRYVESRGGNYVYTYEEPDTSAWKRKRVRLADGRIVYRVIRPVLEGAFEDLKQGVAPNGQRIDGLIVPDLDRLTRDNRHLEDAIEVVENFGRPIIDITGTLDLLTDNGRTVARLLVTVFNKSSSDTARRVKRKHRAMKEAGISTGGTRPTGWNSDKRTLHPTESKVLRSAIDRVFEGASPFTLAGEWNRKGFTTPKGNKWTGYTVRFVLRHPRICGHSYRTVSNFDALTGAENRRIEVVRDEEGSPIVGNWDALASPAEWAALVEILGDNPEPGNGHNARKHQSTGTLRCDKNDCGSLLRAMKAPKRAKKPDDFFYYTCPSKSSGKGCGGITIPGKEVDEAVKMLVIAKYELEASKREAVQAPEEWDRKEELARLREDIQDWKDQRAERKVSKESFFAFIAESEVKERALLRERASYRRKSARLHEQPVNLRLEWDHLSLAEKRGYIERTLIAVLVAPAVGRGRPARERLTPVYRETL
ncbi:recombinase family protein [Kitasatospora sp. NPDC056138]|uniref:recombinase family protein n=1 Tax=Kitasatospora sp. NPDC056138 TaxID=3345724 RepID=UPI0035D7F8BB